VSREQAEIPINEIALTMQNQKHYLITQKLFNVQNNFE